MATPRQLAIACAEACDETKARNIVVLDVRKLTTISDYFVVCTAANERQARAITDAARAEMKEFDRRQLGLEGTSDGKWILQDFADVVIHVFGEDQRDFYDLEGLWADAPRVRWTRKTRKA